MKPMFVGDLLMGLLLGADIRQGSSADPSLSSHGVVTRSDGSRWHQFPPGKTVLWLYAR